MNQRAHYLHPDAIARVERLDLTGTVSRPTSKHLMGRPLRRVRAQMRYRAALREMKNEQANSTSTRLTAEEEAKRFLTVYRRTEAGEYSNKESAAMKRASMDLTRALADVRRST